MLDKETARQGEALTSGSVTPHYNMCPGCGDSPLHWLEIVSEAAANGDTDYKRLLPRLIRHLGVGR